ncbi:TRAP transporter large permease [Alkalihalobacterium alkalinitrilicum]|uniref:TRAP transporter large permease n=1 Tax=Alkalihalobacterium alkalinitrilicum TaxID=427920 RepID=UPI001153D11A|nr:TRAP transporter large permease [Alkalihalobacterium alkalinitrilicum]
MLFVIFFLLIATNMPVAIALGISSLVVLIINDLATLNLFITASFGASDSFPLIAIPLFILAGEIMSKGGIAKRLVLFAEKLVGSFTGGLGIITVIASFIFAAISGSGPATVAAIGGIMLPYMINRGYSKPYAASFVASAGSMGPIVPPSILFILFGVMSGVSIGGLFIAGIIPGILIGIALIIVNYFICKKEGYVGGEKSTFKEMLKAFYDAKFALLAPVIVLGGIYGGIFTPTEAAVVAVFYSLVVSLFVHKEITFKDVPGIFMHTSAVSGGVLILVGAAAFFGRVLSLEQIPQFLSETLSGISSNPIVILLIINVFLLIVGMVMETIAALMIFVPLLLPIVMSLGVDPMHFGIIVCINLTLGLLTPPMGVNVFIASRMAGISFEKTFKYLFPIFSALLVVLLIVTLFPQLSLFLPSILR